MATDIFKVNLWLRDWNIFMWESQEISDVFNTLTLKQILLKMEIFFKKLEYHFLIEGTKIENATFAYKIHGCITKNRVVINYSIFWKILL